MPMIIGENCRRECPEQCMWQMYDYKAGKWKTNENLRVSRELNGQEKNTEELQNQQIFIDNDSNGKYLSVMYLTLRKYVIYF